MPPAPVRDVLGSQIWVDDGGAPPTNFYVSAGFATTVGNKIVVWGHTWAGIITGVTDSRGNTYTVHMDGSGTGRIFLATAPCTTALQVGDQIIAVRTVQTGGGMLVSEWSGLGVFDKAVGATFASTSMVGGSATPAENNELVLGLFYTATAAAGNSHCEIATPGSGFTNQTGAFRNASSGGGYESAALDHEYRLLSGGAGVAVQATATGTVTPTSGSGLTALFTRAPEVYTDAPTGTLTLSGSSTDNFEVMYRATRLVRELPPIRHHVVATTPSGRNFRWGSDEPNAENVFSGLRWGSTMPGGYESCDCVLPRKPGLNYADLDRFTTLRVVNAGGNVVGEYRLERTPQVSGNQMAITPSAVGWQAHLDDNKSVSIIFIDRDLGGWRGPSNARLIALGASWTTNSPEAAPDATAGTPGLNLSLDGAWPAAVFPLAEGWYDAGPGNSIGEVRGSWATSASISNPADAQWQIVLALNNGDNANDGDGNVTDLAGAASGTATRVATTTTRRFALLQFRYGAGPGGVDGTRYTVRWTLVRVIGNHTVPIVGGTAATEGVLCSDVLAYAIAKWAPLLKITGDSIQPTNFVIPQLVFRDGTTVSEIVKSSTRFGLQDWAVWENKIFYLNDRGARGKRWRARIGPARLEQTGQQADRLWESVVVQFNDVDGSTRTVGPPGSGADVTDSRLKDSDPENPANKLSITRREKLIMGVSTSAGAIEVGRRFLEEHKLLDRSGRASLVGYVEDDHGVLWPYSEVRAGDAISFIDAADTSYRRIVKVDHNEREHSASVDLDAPPEGLQAVLERLGVVLAPLGL